MEDSSSMLFDDFWATMAIKVNSFPTVIGNPPISLTDSISNLNFCLLGNNNYINNLECTIGEITIANEFIIEEEISSMLINSTSSNSSILIYSTSSQSGPENYYFNVSGFGEGNGNYYYYGRQNPAYYIYRIQNYIREYNGYYIILDWTNNFLFIEQNGAAGGARYGSPNYITTPLTYAWTQPKPPNRQGYAPLGTVTRNKI
jgi:hypothetical protein